MQLSISSLVPLNDTRKEKLPSIVENDTLTIGRSQYSSVVEWPDTLLRFATRSIRGDFSSILHFERRTDLKLSWNFDGLNE